MIFLPTPFAEQLRLEILCISGMQLYITVIDPILPSIQCPNTDLRD